MPTTDVDPKTAALQMLEAHDEEWVLRFADELDRRLAGHALGRVMRSWHLSVTGLGELFGVSRQAVSKWLDQGIPAERVVQVADVEAISEILERYLRRDRIPAVVRRDAVGLGGDSILSMVAAGRNAEALALTRQMFAFGDTHQ